MSARPPFLFHQGLSLIEAGKLRQSVVLQKRIEVRDRQGGVTESWLTLGHRWASITPLSGRELLNAEQLETDITHRVVMRWEEKITNKHRLFMDGRIFNFQSVLNRNEHGAYLDILAREGNPEDPGKAGESSQAEFGP